MSGDTLNSQICHNIVQNKLLGLPEYVVKDAFDNNTFGIELVRDEVQ